MAARRPAKKKVGRRGSVPDGLDEICDADAACEDDGGDCPVLWEFLCRYCYRRLCVQHAAVHHCASGWLAKRLAHPDLFAPEPEEEDGA